VPADGGTRLVRTHRRLDLPGDFVPSAAGWHAHLEMLDARLARRPTPPVVAAHDGPERLFSRFANG
jgi:hypothetical protein